jgi:hypothetical protein
MNLYRFYWNCGRAGSLESYFVATEEDVQAALGRGVSFGEALGKHSDVTGTLEPEDLVLLPVSVSFVEEFRRQIGSTGLNPLEHLDKD